MNYDQPFTLKDLEDVIRDFESQHPLPKGPLIVCGDGFVDAMQHPLFDEAMRSAAIKYINSRYGKENG